MFLADLIAMAETARKSWTPQASFAKWDEMFYDTALLTPQERTEFEKALPEGAILIVDKPGGDNPKVELCQATDPLSSGEGRAKGVLEDFKAKTAGKPAIDTFVIAGNASSAVGAVALGRSVAKCLNTRVAAIISGQGGYDWIFETLSGGFLLAPTAKLLHAFGEPFEFTAEVNPLARDLIADDIQDVTRSLHEAATLFEILKDRLIEAKDGQIVLKAAADRHLRMIVGHSKANWPILAALLNFELNIADKLQPAAENEPKTHIVTLGNWVSLPDMDPLMGQLFHYHQFVGMLDTLAWSASTSGVRKMIHHWHLANGLPVDHKRNPDELVYLGCGHNLIKANPFHLPIERILPEVLAA